jgi:HEAT repeat protein
VNHSEQIQRIRTKLKAAHKADRKLKVFGARNHKYRIGRAASEREICAFEERYSLVLPGCYRSFLIGVGNGGSSYRNSVAGPFYGIYPLGGGVDEILENPSLFLNKPAIVEPDITEEKWETLTKRLNDDYALADQDFDEELGRLYAGLLPIGSQGCTYLHALVLNGPHAGRVVNLDLDRHRPQFAFERNFLEWYERWLDEVIAGYLLQDGPTWFGYTMAGNDEHLLRVFANAEDHQTRLEALKGLAKLITATQASCRKLLELCGESDAEIRRHALRMLTKFSYPMARAPLRAHLLGDDDHCLAACQSIYSYARNKSKEWSEFLRSRLPAVNTPETFRFVSYLLVESGVDFSEDFRPFCTHGNEQIRVSAFFSLGRLQNKKALVDLFILGLDDASPRVVHMTLQALAGIYDQKLLKAYARVLDRFKTDECYVLTNLELRLKDMGIGSIEKFRK